MYLKNRYSFYLDLKKKIIYIIWIINSIIRAYFIKVENPDGLVHSINKPQKNHHINNPIHKKMLLTYQSKTNY